MFKLTDRQIAEYLYRSYTAVDGLWFVKAEERYGFDVALDIDSDVWKIVPKIQARVLKSIGNYNEGLDALRECFETKLELDGFKFTIEKHASNNCFVVSITDCPWHNIMKKSGREELSGKVGNRICSTEYKVWASEFGNNIRCEFGSRICGGNDRCIFCFKESQ